MTTVQISLEKVDRQQVVAVITTPEGYPLSRRFLEDIVLQEIAMAAGVTLTSARQEWDFDKSTRFDSELPGKKSIQVRLTRHNPEEDLFQKQPDGSYAVTFESLEKLAEQGRKAKMENAKREGRTMK